jgi:hypothetical protein
MPDLVVIVPTRGRPEAAAALAEAFRETCAADTTLVLALDEDDERLPGYRGVVQTAQIRVGEVTRANRSMVEALNRAVAEVLHPDAVSPTFAVGFMGDDHRPRTRGWDERYLAALREMGTGIVYGDDLLRGVNLPTQCAMTADVVRTLGWMCPPELTHMYVDNFWRDLGHAAGCLRYLPDVVVEHLHPSAGKAAWDAGHLRVNHPSMYDRDEAAYTAYSRSRMPADVDRVRMLVRPREHRLFDTDVPYVSTAEYHHDRDRAPHLEQPVHRPRLELAAALVAEVARGLERPTVTDLGCGDGGLLSLLGEIDAWGYDFSPANAAGWAERGVRAEALDVFGADRDRVRLGEVAVMTEVLEHIADPRAALRWVRGHCRYVVASSPRFETPANHAPEHAWAWNEAGYAQLFGDTGWRVDRHETCGPFQVVVAS